MAAWDPSCSSTGTFGTLSFQVPSIRGFECIFRNVLTFVGELAVLIVFMMLILGGFKFITSGGDPKATQSAQQTLTYAIAGFALLVVVWLILRFIAIFTGVNFLIFRIVV